MIELLGKDFKLDTEKWIPPPPSKEPTVLPDATESFKQICAENGFEA